MLLVMAMCLQHQQQLSGSPSPLLPACSAMHPQPNPHTHTHLGLAQNCPASAVPSHRAADRDQLLAGPTAARRATQPCLLTPQLADSCSGRSRVATHVVHMPALFAWDLHVQASSRREGRVGVRWLDVCSGTSAWQGVAGGSVCTEIVGKDVGVRAGATASRQLQWAH